MTGDDVFFAQAKNDIKKVYGVEFTGDDSVVENITVEEFQKSF